VGDYAKEDCGLFEVQVFGSCRPPSSSASGTWRICNNSARERQAKPVKPELREIARGFVFMTGTQSEKDKLKFEL
jgi:hypothetical protein